MFTFNLSSSFYIHEQSFYIMDLNNPLTTNRLLLTWAVRYYYEELIVRTNIAL